MHALIHQFAEQIRAHSDKHLRWMRRWLPLCLFVGGFVLDAVTLSGEVAPLALAAVGLYALLVAMALVLRGRGLLVRFERWVTLGLHLGLGSLFSALSVLYFRSSGDFFAFVVVLVLFALMVFNEFARRDDSQRELLWGIYCVSLVMLLNFGLPHLVGSVKPVWFYVSSAVAVALVLGLRVAAAVPLKTVRSALAAAVLLVALYPLGLIPPVPLVMENSLVGVNFRKDAGEYSCEVETPGRFERLPFVAHRVHRERGQALYVLTAISAPRDAVARLEHRWSRKGDEGWTLTDTIPIAITGGRKAGWRAYSFKRNIVPGIWRVETALVGGAVLGAQVFVVEEVPEGTPLERTRAVL